MAWWENLMDFSRCEECGDFFFEILIGCTTKLCSCNLSKRHYRGKVQGQYISNPPCTQHRKIVVSKNFNDQLFWGYIVWTFLHQKFRKWSKYMNKERQKILSPGCLILMPAIRCFDPLAPTYCPRPIFSPKSIYLPREFFCQFRKSANNFPHCDVFPYQTPCQTLCI